MTQPANENQTSPAATTQPDDEFARLLDKGYRSDGAFQRPSQFSFAQRVGKMLITSEMVPPHFRGADKLANAVIAIDIAMRLKMSPLLVMKQIYMVYGQPAFSAQLAIAAINCSEKFSRIKFRIDGEGDNRGCVAYATDLSNGETLESSRVSIELAKKEGWFSKKDSKWQTMPDQMLMYRSAAWWGRAYAPELLMGLSTEDELRDLGPPEIKVEKPIFKSLPAPTPPVMTPDEKAQLKLNARVNGIQFNLQEKNLAEIDLLNFLKGIGMIGETVTDLHLLTDEVLSSIHEQLPDIMERILEAKPCPTNTTS